MPSNCPLLTADPLGGDGTITCRPEHERVAIEFVALMEGSGFVPQAKTLNQRGDLLSATLTKGGR